MHPLGALLFHDLWCATLIAWARVYTIPETEHTLPDLRMAGADGLRGRKDRHGGLLPGGGRACGRIATVATRRP